MKEEFSKLFDSSGNSIDNMLTVLRTGVEKDISQCLISITTEFWDAAKSYAFQAVVDTNFFGVKRRMPTNWKEFHSTMLRLVFEMRVKET